MRKHFLTGLLCLLLFAGVALLLYPTLSEGWSRHSQAQAIDGYTGAAAGMDAGAAARMWAEAEAYNADLWQSAARYTPTAEEHARYLQTLDVDGTGIMGYVEIPKIDVALPIYHGTGEDALQAGVGHLEGSSLPVGGAGTHCVLSGHRGLPSARLFTDLDQLAEGDVFLLKVLSQTLAYEVDQITVVLPEQLGDLELAEGQDYCTLITCTPYGVNSHRMLVRGHRTQAAGSGAGGLRRTGLWPIVILIAAALLSLALPLGRRRRQDRHPTGNEFPSGEGPQ